MATLTRCPRLHLSSLNMSIFSIYFFMLALSFHLKSPKKVQNETAPTQILMKVHTYSPCYPNRRNPIFFFNLTSYFQIYGSFKFYENIHFRVKGLFKKSPLHKIYVTEQFKTCIPKGNCTRISNLIKFEIGALFIGLPF